MELVPQSSPAVPQPQHKPMLPPRGTASVRLPGLGMAGGWICHPTSSQPGWSQNLASQNHLQPAGERATCLILLVPFHPEHVRLPRQPWLQLSQTIPQGMNGSGGIPGYLVPLIAQLDQNCPPGPRGACPECLNLSILQRQALGCWDSHTSCPTGLLGIPKIHPLPTMQSRKPEELFTSPFKGFDFTGDV